MSMRQLCFSTRTSETRTNAYGATVRVQYLLTIIKNHVEHYGNTLGSELPLQDLEDLCSDISLNVLESLDRFNPDRASLNTWVSHIAYHAEVDCFKRYMGRVTRERDCFYSKRGENGYSQLQRCSHAARSWEPDAELESADSLEHIERARRSLNPRYQDAIRLTEQGAGPQDIADSYGISESAAGTLVSRARGAFRKKLRDEFDDSFSR